MRIAYKDTFNGRMKEMYRLLSRRCRNDKRYGGVKMQITEEQLVDFLSSDNSYREIYHDWVKSGFVKRFTPSVDRVDNSRGYVIGNIQVLSTYENMLKSDGPDIPDLSFLFNVKKNIIWHLDSLGYSGSAIGDMMNVNRSTVCRIMKERPKTWSFENSGLQKTRDEGLRAFKSRRVKVS